MCVCMETWMYHTLPPYTDTCSSTPATSTESSSSNIIVYIYIFNIYTYVCIYCTHIFMHVCMYGNMYVRKYVCITHYLRTQTRAALHRQHPQNQAPATKTKAVFVIRSWLVFSHPNFPAPIYMYVHIYIYTHEHTNQDMYI